MHQSGQPFASDLKICIALFPNERSDAERIKKAARRLVHQLRGRHPEGCIRSNPIEHLVKKPLSLLEHATDEGIHNEFRNRSCKHGQCQWRYFGGNPHWNERQINPIATLSNKVHRKADSRIQTKTYLPRNQPPNTWKQNRGLKSTEEQNCFPRQDVPKEPCTNLSECPNCRLQEGQTTQRPLNQS